MANDIQKPVQPDQSVREKFEATLRELMVGFKGMEKKLGELAAQYPKAFDATVTNFKGKETGQLIEAAATNLDKKQGKEPAPAQEVSEAEKPTTPRMGGSSD